MLNQSLETGTKRVEKIESKNIHLNECVHVAQHNEG